MTNEWLYLKMRGIAFRVSFCLKNLVSGIVKKNPNNLLENQQKSLGTLYVERKFSTIKLEKSECVCDWAALCLTSKCSGWLDNSHWSVNTWSNELTKHFKCDTIKNEEKSEEALQDKILQL